MTRDDIKKSATKPAPMPVLADNLPCELKAVPQWVCWRWEFREGEGWTKPPVNPRTGANAQNNNPKTWGTFDQAWNRYQSGTVDGIGFEFAADDGFSGIDLDDCRDPETGKIEEWAEKIIQAFDSYSEVSPSGTGFKIVVRGKLSFEQMGGKHKRKEGNIEIFCRNGYFTLTGAIA